MMMMMMIDGDDDDDDGDDDVGHWNSRYKSLVETLIILNGDGHWSSR